jgi:alpha-1,6-mannosyltransferase
LTRPALHRASLWVLGGGLLALQVAGLYLQARQSFQGVVTIALLEGGVYLAAVHCVQRLGLASRALTLILVVAALLRAMTVMMPPYLSSDMYRYVWDGRVQGAGINPYRYVPADEALTALRDDAIYPNINRSGYARTIYPPAAQMIYFAVTRLSERVTAMKLAMLAFEAVAILLLIGLLRRSGSPVDQVLIYAWHPLTVWEIAGSGHVDAAMVAFLVLALWARQRRLPVLCGLALAGSTLIKFLPVVLAPALYRRWDWKMPTAFAVAALLLYLPYLSVGWKVLGFLPSYWTEERLVSGSGFFLMNLAGWLSGRSDLPSLPYLAAAAVGLGTVALAVLFARRPADNGYLGGSLTLAAVFVLVATPHYPWYFLWLLPLLCLVPYWPMLLLTSASFLLYLALANRSPASELLVNSLLYGLFLAAVVVHLGIRRWRRTLAGPAVASGAPPARSP